MTYPQQQYPPQGYPAATYPQGYPQQPPAQQYGAPQGYPGAVVTYPAPPQPPAQPAGPQQGQGIVPSTPQLGDGGGNGGGQVSPKLRHLDGRTIVVLPHRVNEDAIDPDTKAKRPEAHFDLVVVDGGPLRYGDNIDDRNPHKNRPNTHEIDTPCVFVNASDIGGSFVNCVRDAIAAGEPGRAGIIERGNRGFRPYLITRCGEHVDRSTRQGGDAKYAAAMQIFDLIWQDKHSAPGAPKRFISPEPRSLVVAPPPGQPQVAYGAPQQQAYVQPSGAAYQSPAPAGYAQQQYQQTGAVPTPYGAAPAANLHPEYVAAATQPGYGAYPQSAPPAQYVPHPAEAQLPPPVKLWLDSLPAEQRAASLAAYLAQQQGQGAPQAQAQPTGPGM